MCRRLFHHTAGLLLLTLAAEVHAAGVPRTFGTVEELRRAETGGLQDNQVARVLGYHAPNDGGGGEFYWIGGSAATLPVANLGTVIAPLGDGDAGRWVRLVNSHRINVLWFGVRPVAFDDPDIGTASVRVAASNLARLRNAMESMPVIPGGTSAAGPARHVELHFPAMPFVRAAGRDGGPWISNTQATCYFISDTLQVTKNCTVSGDGLDRTHLAFPKGAAPDAKREKFVIEFSKWGITGTPPSQGETFECHLRDLTVSGGTDNAGSSGVAMDGAQMSSISNVAVTDVGLRGIVACAYFLHNLSISRVARGPGLEVTQQGSDFGFVCASHIFVGFVNVEETERGFVAGPHRDHSPTGMGDGDHWPAVQLNRCEHFTCANLRIERAPIALKVGLCGHVLVQHLSASAPGRTKGLSAVKLQNPRDRSYVGSVEIQGMDVNGYDHVLWDHADSPDATRTPSDLKLARLSSFRRDGNGLHSGTMRLQGQGAESPLQIFAHPHANGGGAWLCQFFDRPLATKADDARPTFRVRNDGLIESRGGTVPVATQPLQMVQSPVLRSELPALGALASQELVFTLEGTELHAGDAVTLGFVRREGAAALPPGIVADASVVDAHRVAVRFSNLRAVQEGGGQPVEFRILVHATAGGKETP